MARLFEYSWDKEEEETKPNFEVKERDNRRFVIWSEDLDVISIDVEELRVLAKALGYRLMSLTS